MTENLNKRPPKSILKSSSSFDKPQQSHGAADGGGCEGAAAATGLPKTTKFDEMNIIETLHPADKDYGHMKIEEPKTPYRYLSEDPAEELDPQDLSERITTIARSSRDPAGADGPSSSSSQHPNSDNSDDSDSESTNPEERKVFDAKRKAHYNEYYAVKLARKLMLEEEEGGGGGGDNTKFIPVEELLCEEEDE